MNEKDHLLTAFVQALDDHPLEAGSSQYVPDLHKDAATGDPINQLAWQIGTHTGGATYFFSGMIGSGKSTELMRLKSMLEKKGHIVVYADMANYVNFGSPTEISDLLMSVVGAFSDRAGEILGQDPARQTFWERLTNFLASNVKIAGVDLGAQAALPGVGGPKVEAKLKLELERNPNFKVELQKAMRGMVGVFVEDVRIFVRETSELLLRGRSADTKLVLLLDSLEKMQGKGYADDEVMMSLRQLFRQNMDELRLPPLQIVYSIAPYLRKLEPAAFSQVASASICSLTAIPVYKRQSHHPRNEAVAQMRQVIERRFPDWPKVLGQLQLDDLIRASGGDLRELLRLLSTLIANAATNDAMRLPLDQKAIENAKIAVRRNYLPLPDDIRARLKPIHDAGQPDLSTEKTLDGFVQDLNTKRVMMYRNGEEWYGVHPLLWPSLAPTKP